VLSAAEKKRLKHAAKRQTKKAEIEQVKTQEVERASVVPCTLQRSGEDPNGVAWLVKLVDPLGEARKVLSQSVSGSSGFETKDPHVWSLKYEVGSRTLTPSSDTLLELAVCIEKATMLESVTQRRRENIGYQSPFTSVPWWSMTESVPCLLNFLFVQVGEPHENKTFYKPVKTAVETLLLDRACIDDHADSSSGSFLKSLVEGEMVKSLHNVKSVNTVKEAHCLIRCLWSGTARDADEKVYSTLAHGVLEKVKFPSADRSDTPGCVFGPFPHWQKLWLYLSTHSESAAGLLASKAALYFSTPLAKTQESA